MLRAKASIWCHNLCRDFWSIQNNHICRQRTCNSTRADQVLLKMSEEHFFSVLFCTTSLIDKGAFSILGHTAFKNIKYFHDFNHLKCCLCILSIISQQGLKMHCSTKRKGMTGRHERAWKLWTQTLLMLTCHSFCHTFLQLLSKSSNGILKDRQWT